MTPARAARAFLWCLIAAAGGVTAAGGAAVGEAASPASRQELPEGVTPETVRQGERIYAGPGYCATCHGERGRGVRGVGSDLTDDRWLHLDGSYRAIVRVVREGIPAERSRVGLPMPAKGGGSLTDEQVAAVAAYVWTLSRRGGR